MNSFDIAVLIVVILLAGLWGKKGFLKAVLGLIGFQIAFLVATRTMATGGLLVSQSLSVSPTIGQVIAYSGIFFLVLIFYKMLVSAVLKRLMSKVFGTLDHIGGVVFGGLFGVVILAVIIGSLNLLPIRAQIAAHTEHSRSYPYLIQVFNAMLSGSDWIYPGSRDTYLNLMSNLAGMTSGGLSLPMPEIFQDAQKGLESLNLEGDARSPYQDMFDGLGLDSLDVLTLDQLMKKTGK